MEAQTSPMEFCDTLYIERNMLRLMRYGLQALCFGLCHLPFGEEDVDDLGESIVLVWIKREDLLKHAKGLLVLMLEAVHSSQFVIASCVLRSFLHGGLKGGNGVRNVFLAQISMTHNEMRSGITGLKLEEFVASLESLVKRLGLQR